MAMQKLNKKLESLPNIFATHSTSNRLQECETLDAQSSTDLTCWGRIDCSGCNHVHDAHKF